MSQVIKSYIGLFLLLTMIVTSAGILSGYITVLQAQNTHAAMIDEIEESCFYPKVIRECFDIADDRDYNLLVTLYGEEGRVVNCSSKEQVPEDTGDINLAKVEITYSLFFSGTGTKCENRLEGFAR